MPRTAQMAQLSRRLRGAANQQDWLSLASADQDLLALLSSERKGPPFSRSERLALQDLKLAHQQARLQCDSAIDLLSQRMAQLQTNREGWLAYGLYNPQDTSEA